MNNYSLLFCQTLKYIRLERGMTQEELANNANINEKHYGRIERGECSPSLDFFFLLCNALDIRPDKFFEFMISFNENNF